MALFLNFLGLVPEVFIQNGDVKKLEFLLSRNIVMGKAFPFGEVGHKES